MKYKKWLLITLILYISPLLYIGGFNMFIDPLWMFNHKHKYNDIQGAYNERQQKVNKIAYNNFNYDTLLLGSSRTTYINQNDFEGLKVFNFAVSSMSIQEYKAFIEFAIRNNNNEFDNIIIGLDFFATSSSRDIINPYEYIKNTKDFLYPIKVLLSYDTYKVYSVENFKASYRNEYIFMRNYNRHNIAVPTDKQKETNEARIKDTLKTYENKVYGETYEYNNNYKRILKELKQSNPDVNFIIFTTPVTSSLFNSLIESGRLSDYQRWLKDVVEVFGEVHHFMYVNSVTTNFSNYYDGHHFYPHVGSLIAHRIVNNQDPNLPNDFGILITKDNIDFYLKDLEDGLINE